MHLCWKSHVLTNVIPCWPNHVSHLARGGWADPSLQAGLAAGGAGLFSFACVCCQLKA